MDPTADPVTWTALARQSRGSLVVSAARRLATVSWYYLSVAMEGRSAVVPAVRLRAGVVLVASGSAVAPLGFPQQTWRGVDCSIRLAGGQGMEAFALCAGCGPRLPCVESR